MEHVASCHFFSWEPDESPPPEGYGSATIDGASLVLYHVLNRLPDPFGMNDKALNAEKEGMAKGNDVVSVMEEVQLHGK